MSNYPHYSPNMQEKQISLHRDFIDPEALKIVETLSKNGFVSYLVGGCVRDLLLGHPPKDFDIVTNARPNEVRKAVSQAYVIGKRFRLVLVKRGSLQFEVATFRRNIQEGEEVSEKWGSDNVFGSPVEDAERRDFTINALFYDPVKDELIDYCHGLADIDSRYVRMIGDPDLRLQEDPIRILRALRLAHKLGFTIETELRQACQRNSHLLKLSVLPRRREEFLKLLRLEDPSLAFHEAFDLGIWREICPTLNEVFQDSQKIKEFDSYLNRIHHYLPAEAEPVELLGYFLLSYYRAAKNSQCHEPVSADQFLQDPDLIRLMRDEFGLFKYEQAMIAKAFQLQNSLQKTQEFKSRGIRKRSALVGNDGFSVALIFAQADYSVSPSDLFFWLEQRTLHRPKVDQTRRKSNSTKQRPQSRNRRRFRSRSMARLQNDNSAIDFGPEDERKEVNE